MSPCVFFEKPVDSHKNLLETVFVDSRKNLLERFCLILWFCVSPCKLFMLHLTWPEDRATLASDLSAVPGAKTKVGGGRAIITLSPPSDWQ
jgi:hypothetical protein